MPIFPKTPEERHARTIKFGWIICWLYLANNLGAVYSIFSKKIFADPHLFVKLMCGFYLVLFGIALYGYAKKKTEMFEPFMYFQLIYAFCFIGLMIGMISNPLNPTLMRVTELMAPASFVMTGAIFSLYVRHYLWAYNTEDLSKFSGNTRASKIVFALVLVAIAGFGFFLWRTLEMQRRNLDKDYGLEGEDKIYFEKNNVAVWQRFCELGQTKLADAQALCESRPECVFAVAHMKKPCEEHGAFENTIYWFTNSTAGGKAECLVMKTNTATKSEEPVSEGSGFKVPDLKADGNCDAGKIQALIQRADSFHPDGSLRTPSQFNDQRPMPYMNFSSRVTAVYARSPEILTMWNQLAHPPTSTPGHYSDADWAALPKQTDAYYTMLKGYFLNPNQ